MSNEMSYQSAFDELTQIIQEIESGEIGVDVLSEKVKKAAQLITFCKEKLKATELDVEKILDEMK